jgi:4'-phosphopantetheinyl transferase EntD
MAQPMPTLTLAAATRPLDPAALSRCELARFALLASGARRREWLLGRSALRRLLARLGAGLDTSGIEFPNARYSLTHSGGVAVAAGVIGPAPRGLGIDLELGRALDPRAARFFLTPQERSWAECAGQRARAALLRLWTAKEALFKADPDNAGRVLADYRLVEPQLSAGWATLARPGRASFRYASFRFGDGYLSVAAALKGAAP